MRCDKNATDALAAGKLDNATAAQTEASDNREIAPCGPSQARAATTSCEVSSAAEEPGAAPSSLERKSSTSTVAKATDSTICWYVMRAVACGCHKSIRATLEEAEIEFFQPLHYVVRRKAGRIARSLEPLISNIFFVHGSKKELLPYTTDRCNHFQFYYDHCSGKQADCLRVPDKQMSDFMRIYRETLSDPQVFTLGELQLKPGTRVRILGGPFHGVEGTYQKVKGHRNRQLIVTLEGLLAITAAISPELVEIVKV